MKLNVLTPEGKVTAHLRHIRHVMVNIFDPTTPKVIILNAKQKEVLAIEYTSEEAAQAALTACTETIRKHEVIKEAMRSGDPMRVPRMADFQFPTLVMEATDA